MLTDLIRLPIIPPDRRLEVEDIYSSSLSTLFANDVQTQHGDAGSYVIYKSKRFGDLELRLIDPTTEDERTLFAHFLWNASVQVAELISGCATGLEEEEKASWNVTGKKVLELGAGTGLAGIVSGLAGASDVAISDYPSPEIIASINSNVEKNVPEYIRNTYINQHHMTWGEEDAEFPAASYHSGMRVYGHKWGDLNDQLSRSHKGCFDRIIAADGLWMVGEHENLADSMLHFLSRDAHAQVWVIAGFHTGRATLASFFNTALEKGLEISQIYERDVNGHERLWKRERDGGREDVTGRKRWLVIAVLKRRSPPPPPSTRSEWRDSTATLAFSTGMGNSTTTLVP